MTLSDVFNFEKLKDMFDFSGISDPAPIWILLACIVTVGIGLFFLSSCVDKRRGIVRHTTTKEVVYGAACVALSFVLSFVRLYRMPYGGSITLASVLPIALYCYVFGFRKGMLVCFVFALLNFCQGPYVINAWSALFDYLLPYLAVTLVGIFALRPDSALATNKPLRKHGKFFAGIACYFVLRMASHIAASMLFWTQGVDFGAFQGDLVGWTAFAYGLVYNLLFLLPDTLIVGIAALSLFSSRAINTVLTAMLRSATEKKTQPNAVPATAEIANAVQQEWTEKTEN